MSYVTETQADLVGDNIRIRTLLQTESGEHLAELTNKILRMEDVAVHNSLIALGWLPPMSKLQTTADVYEWLPNVQEPYQKRSWHLVNVTTGEVVQWLNATKNMWRTNNARYFINLDRAKRTLLQQVLDAEYPTKVLA